jgi:hypothetical protein
MPLRLKTRHLIFPAALIIALFIYQNCADVQNDSLNSASSFEAQLPFAYNPVVDTIAYMSCSEMSDTSFEPRAYFTFRAGAYNASTGGLTLTTLFRQATAYYAPTDRGNALSLSDVNNNTLLSLSIRSASNYQSLWATDSVTAGNELDAFLPQLNSDFIAGPLATSGSNQMINYFPGNVDQRLMEASLRFLKFENVAADTRKNIDNGSALLVAGFTKSADVMDQGLRSPVDFTFNEPAPTPTPNVTPTEANRVYGIGYKLAFSLPEGYSNGDLRVLSSLQGIQEIDLSTGQMRAANWDCSQNYEFMIVRPEDKVAGVVYCNAIVDRYNGGTQQAQLAALRRVLRVEDWWIDLDNRCVMPKNSPDFCYGGTLGTRAIQYGIASCVDGQTTVCPHFVSVCIRH